MAKKKKVRKDHTHKIAGKGKTGPVREMGAGRHDHKDPTGGRVSSKKSKSPSHTHVDKRKRKTAKPVMAKKKAEFKIIGV